MSLQLFPPLIGIQCSDGVLRAVLFNTRWLSDNETVDKVCEVDVPSELLTADGLIKNAAECGRLLQVELAKHGVSGGNAAILLPADRVFSHQLSLPVGPARRMEGAIRAEIEHIIPEDPAVLQITHQVLSHTKQMQEIAVAAVRKDLVDRYAEMVRVAGLTLNRMTTFPAALACCTKGRTFLLLIAPGTGVGGTLTFIHERWPLDEALLPPDMTEDEIVEEIRRMITEYAKRGIVSNRLVYVGDQTLEDRLKQVSVSEWKGEVAIEHFEPRLEKDRVWSSLLVLCIAPINKLTANFVKRAHMKPWQLALIGLCLVVPVVVYFVVFSS